MPGPVSDSYDPVWSTGANREEVVEAIREVIALASKTLKSEPKHMLEVVRMKRSPLLHPRLSERQWRIVRFALRVALEEEDL